MYQIEFKVIKDDEYYDEYVATKKLKNGQTVYIAFQENIVNYYDYKKVLEYNIYLVIYKKRKELNNVNYECINPIHKAGMEGMIFAYNAVKEFEQYIIDKKNSKIRIRCYWGDNRRKNIYERYLNKIGYEIKFLNNQKRLVKNLN